MDLFALENLVDAAFSRKAGVEFIYIKADGKTSVRSVVAGRVEVTAKGDKVLIGYDLGRRGIRKYRLDRIHGEPVAITRPGKDYDSEPYEVEEV